MNELSPQTEKFAEITGTILAILLIITLASLLIFSIYYDFKKMQAQNEYIRTLNEHDKAVITDYRTIKPKLIKRKEHK